MTERRQCPIHNVYEDVEETKIDQITYRQKFSCGFENNLKKIPAIVENLEIEDKVKSVTTIFSYGQVQADKTTKDSRSIPCKCGHRGNEHKFLSGYTGNHNCYRCECTDYRSSL